MLLNTLGMLRPLAVEIQDLLSTHLHWIIFGGIVAAGLGIGLYFGDLLRFSFYRIRAVSSVSFAESLRRRVLLITPLAILGIIIVSQLQHPVDAADALRQTIKVALFATGMVVVIATIIMACTNLPKEIESRVIYTVVTKPTTRLEIVLGKVLGFAKVSALLLLIMGVFTWGYVSFRAWNFQREVRTLLAEGRVEDFNKQSYQHYAEAGLLKARKYERPRALEVLAKVPEPTSDQRWFYGSSEQDVLVPFNVQAEEFIGPGLSAIDPHAGAVIVAQIDYTQRDLTPAEARSWQDEGAADLGGIGITNAGPLASGVPSTSQPTRLPPTVVIQILDRNRNSFIPSQYINGGKQITLIPGRPIEASIAGDQLVNLARAGKFFIDIIGVSPGTTYGMKTPADPKAYPVSIIVPGASSQYNEIHPANVDPEREGTVVATQFRGRLGISGQQLRGGPKETTPAAVYSFHDVPVSAGADGKIPFEITVGIEKSGDEAEAEDLTHLSISVLDAKGGKTYGPIEVLPESNRPSYFSVPAEWVQSGNFDVIVNNLTPGHWATIKSQGVSMIVQNQPFALNLFKGLLIMWLLSILVIVVSIFSSTFLSWPIAIVLTLVILLGHWGVDQLGDATSAGIGNQVATDLGFRDAAKAKVVSTSVEALSKFLNTVSAFLPDISAFGGAEEVEKGIAIPAGNVTAAVLILLVFGIPLTMAAYVILRFKEVAP